MNKYIDLKKLIQKLAKAQCEYDLLVSDEEDVHELGPPASPKQIAKIEGILGKPLPSSYRAFLELHNGWNNFDGGAKLLAIEDHECDWVTKRLEELSVLFEDDSENPFQNGAIPILLGKDEHNFLILDPSEVRENGEMNFVMYDYAQEEEKFKDFISFLQDTLKTIEELIEEEKHGITDENLEDEDLE